MKVNVHASPSGRFTVDAVWKLVWIFCCCWYNSDMCRFSQPQLDHFFCTGCFFFFFSSSIFAISKPLYPVHTYIHVHFFRCILLSNIIINKEYQLYQSGHTTRLLYYFPVTLVIVSVVRLECSHFPGNKNKTKMLSIGHLHCRKTHSKNHRFLNYHLHYW